MNYFNIFYYIFVIIFAYVIGYKHGSQSIKRNKSKKPDGMEFGKNEERKED